MPACFFHWTYTFFTFFVFSIDFIYFFILWIFWVLTGCLCEVDTHTTDREELRASLTDVVNCIGGDISLHSRGKEHLLLQAADVNIALCVVGLCHLTAWELRQTKQATRLQNCIRQTLKEHEFAWRSLSLDKLLCNVFNQSHINKPASPAGPWEPSQWKHSGRYRGG